MSKVIFALIQINESASVLSLWEQYCLNNSSEYFKICLKSSLRRANNILVLRGQGYFFLTCKLFLTDSSLSSLKIFFCVVCEWNLDMFFLLLLPISQTNLSHSYSLSVGGTELPSGVHRCRWTPGLNTDEWKWQIPLPHPLAPNIFCHAGNVKSPESPSPCGNVQRARGRELVLHTGEMTACMCERTFPAHRPFNLRLNQPKRCWMYSSF